MAVIPASDPWVDMKTNSVQPESQWNLSGISVESQWNLSEYKIRLSSYIRNRTFSSRAARVFRKRSTGPKLLNFVDT